MLVHDDHELRQILELRKTIRKLMTPCATPHEVFLELTQGSPRTHAQRNDLTENAKKWRDYASDIYKRYLKTMERAFTTWKLTTTG
jgi:hypothetical protein